MAERTSSGLLMEPPPAAAVTLLAEVRERLAELELELSEGNPPTMRRTTDSVTDARCSCMSFNLVDNYIITS